MTAHLHLVDRETGEVLDACPGCEAAKDVIAGLERDIRGWASRYAILKRDKDQKALEHPLWTVGVRRFDAWRRLCRHPKAQFDPDRFWLVEPFLSDDERNATDFVERAIRGAAYDPYTTRRRNGSVQRHDGWELIFKDRGKFESFCNRAPIPPGQGPMVGVSSVGAAPRERPAPGTTAQQEASR